MHHVVITDTLTPPAEIEERVLTGVAQIECLQARSIDELRGRLDPAQALIVFHEVSIPAEIVDELRQCRVIVRGGVGYDNIDIQSAGQRGIPVCHVPDYGVDEVADHALGLMLAANRGIIQAERNLRWTLRPWDCSAFPAVPRLVNATLGIIGCGRIGSAMAMRAKALKMRVVVYDPYLRPGMDKVLGVQLTDFPSLLKTSDVISLHTPLTQETHHLIDVDALSMMKQTALLINTARGAVVDTNALAAALTAGKIAGAGIDVLPDEPPDESMPMIKLWQSREHTAINLILTPHVAYYSREAQVEVRTKAAEEVARILRGRPPRNCVNHEWLK